MYNKNNLAIAKVVSTSGMRPALQCVAFYGDRTVATDTFRAIEMSATGEKHDIQLCDARVLPKLKKKETTKEFSMSALAGADEYPLVDKVFDDQFSDIGKEYVSVTLNGQYLAEILKILADMNSTGRVTLQIETSGLTKHAVRLFATDCGTANSIPTQKARALFMPMNR